MYLFSQMASYLFMAFLLGAAVGYALWRSWGEREVIAKYNAAEMRLAAHLARWEQTAAHSDHGRGDAARQSRVPGADVEKRWEETARRELHDFEVKQAAMMREAEDAAIRKAEAAAEKKLADFANRLGQPASSPGGTQPPAQRHAPEPELRDPTLPPELQSSGVVQMPLRKSE